MEKYCEETDNTANAHLLLYNLKVLRCCQNWINQAIKLRTYPEILEKELTENIIQLQLFFKQQKLKIFKNGYTLLVVLTFIIY